MAGILSSIVVGYFVAGALGKTGVIDDNGAHQCDWNPAGPLNPHLSKRACSLPFSENRASTVSSWRPWTHRPVCTSAKTKSRYCAFVKDDFRGESSILILTSPEVAAGDLSFVDDFDTQWLESGPLFPLPETAPYEVKEMAGKGFGIVVNSTIPAGNVIMREYPAILQTTSTELSGKIDAGEALWVLEEGFIRLPTKDQLKVFNLARSTGGHVLEDTIRTNTFGVTFNNASHYGLFPGVARINHACKPNAITRFSPRTLALEVFAYRDIQAGEELSISYAPLNMIYEDRQKTLKDWGFNCTCSLCSSSSDIVAASDGRRERIQQILSALDNPVFRSSATLIGELADEVDVILEKEGLTAQRGDFYDILARVYIDMGDVKLGRKYAEMAAEKLAHFAGYDDERTERARVLLGELGKAGAT